MCDTPYRFVVNLFVEILIEKLFSILGLFHFTEEEKVFEVIHRKLMN